jgi:hypothetical protein
MTGGVISYNQALGTAQNLAKGGGLYFAGGGGLTLTNVSITFNKALGASGKGGGFYIAGGAVTFNNCNLTNNAAPAGPGGAWKAPGSYTKNGGNWTDAVFEDM